MSENGMLIADAEHDQQSSSLDFSEITNKLMICWEDFRLGTEYDIYCNWNEWLSSEFNVKPNAYIYLQCNPNVNSERICQRSRDGENNIPLEYLEKLHQKHEEWMNYEIINFKSLIQKMIKYIY